MALGDMCLLSLNCLRIRQKNVTLVHLFL